MPPRTPYKATTLHDVAAHAGVSLITASRALGKPKLVSAQTIARVQQAVAATGYIPNLMAGGLKSKKSRLVACVVPSVSVPQFLPTVQALTDTLAAEGYQLILGQTGYDTAREEALLNSMMSRQPDGMVFTGLIHAKTVRDKLRRMDLPVVETWDLTNQPTDMLVGFSHAQVGEAVAAYFKRKGWRHVGMATGDDPRALQRTHSFHAAMGRKLPLAQVPAPSSLALGRQALVQLLRQSPRLEAVYCSSDQMAHGVMTEALARGLRVPQDLAVFGFGDAAFAAHTQPALSTVQVDGPAIGRLAAQLILQRCRGEAVKTSLLDLGFRIVERHSTAEHPA